MPPIRLLKFCMLLAFLDFAAAPLRAAGGRIPISSVPYTISQPGVYYLTRDLTQASGDNITVNADHVVVDLAGHTLSNTGANWRTIYVGSAGANVRVTNGRVIGGQYGIYIESAVANAVFQLDHLAVSGQSNAGIYVFSLTAAGTNARVVIEDNLLTAINATGINLFGVQNGRIERNLISRCNTGILMDTSQSNRIVQNVSSGNLGAGIYLSVSSDNTLDRNSAVGNGATGINLVGGGNNIYSNNRLSGNTGGNGFASGVSAGGNNAGAANF